MKKLILVFMMIFSCIISSYAQQYQVYQTSSLAFARVVNGHYYWGDWEKCTVKIIFDMTNDIITIYSQSTQKYVIYDSYNNANAYYDKDGGKQVKFYVIDQDYDKGTVRLRIEKNGNSQIYIDFNDCAWVYNVVRIN